MFQRNLLPLSSGTSKTLAPVYMTLHPQDSILTAVTASTSHILNGQQEEHCHALLKKGQRNVKL